ncbi:MAG: SNF2-related protein [Patescibacteria group bacterium]|nr:SNF2-related protein [Patescibacteria group bacterium]
MPDKFKPIPEEIKAEKPKDVEVEKLEDIDSKNLPQVDKETGIYTDENEEEWATIDTASQLLGLSGSAIRRHISHVRSIQGRSRETPRISRRGRACRLFNIADIIKILILPQVDKETGIYTDSQGEQWAVLKVAAELIGIAPQTIQKYLSGVRSIQGRGRGSRETGVGSPHDLFNLADIKNVLSEIITIPQVDKETGVYVDPHEEEWVTVKTASEILDLPFRATRRHLSGVRSIRGRDRTGQTTDPGEDNLFNLADIKKVFSEILVLPQVDKETGIYTDTKGERWATVHTAEQLFGVGRITIKNRLSSVRSIRGKDRIGQAPNSSEPDNLFNLADIKLAVADILEKREASANEQKIKKSYQEKMAEYAEGKTESAENFRALINAFGSANCIDILYRLHPEYKGLPMEYVKSQLADYLGDVLLVKGEFRFKDLIETRPFLSDNNFSGALFENIKEHCLRYFFEQKRREPEKDSLEIIYDYLDRTVEEARALGIKELDDIIQAVIVYYDAAIRDFKKPEVFKDRLSADRDFPDINQKINMKELADKKRLLIADDMGLGKSASVIMAKEQLGIKRTLVIAPSNVIATWQKYLSDGEEGYYQPGKGPRVLAVESQDDLKNLDKSEYDYILISHERLDSSSVEKLKESGFDMLAVDEAHKLKNPAGKRSEQAFELAEALDPEKGYLALLSGTPAPNKVGDIAFSLKMLYPEKFAGVSNRALTEQIIRGDMLDLRSLLVPRLQMKDLRESVEMPELRDEVTYVELSELEKEVYEVLVEEDELTATDKMKVLRQFLLNPETIVTDPNIEGSKIKKAGRDLRKAFGEHDKVVMFVNDYMEGVIRGEKGISDKLGLPDNVNVKTIHGPIPMNERPAIQQEFNEGAGKMLLVVSGGTADVGVDFSGGQKLFFYNEPWTEYQRRQELGRVYRPGIKNSLSSETLVVQRTIEQGIHEYIGRKYRAIEKLLRGVPNTELEKTLLRETEKVEDPSLEVNPELARYYFSCWDKMMQFFGYVKELGEVKFEKFLADYGRDYAQGYRELGNRSYQSNANRVAGALIDKFAAEAGLPSKEVKILDLASGPEMLRRHIGEKFQKQVVSLDINPHHLQQARGDVVVSSARKTPFKDKSFEYLNFALAWHYSRLAPSQGDYERVEVLAEANRVLKEKGRLVMSLIYSVDLDDEDKFSEAVGKLGFKVVDEYSGEVAVEKNYLSKMIVLEKVRDLDGSPEEVAGDWDKQGARGFKLKKKKVSLKNSRKIIEHFPLNGKEFPIELNADDKAVLEEERVINAEAEVLKKKFGGIKNIPREEIIAGNFVRILLGAKFILFKKLKKGSGAVMVKD